MLPPPPILPSKIFSLHNVQETPNREKNFRANEKMQKKRAHSWGRFLKLTSKTFYGLQKNGGIRALNIAGTTSKGITGIGTTGIEELSTFFRLRSMRQHGRFSYSCMIWSTESDKSYWFSIFCRSSKSLQAGWKIAIFGVGLLFSSLTEQTIPLTSCKRLTCLYYRVFTLLTTKYASMNYYILISYSVPLSSKYKRLRQIWSFLHSAIMPGPL